MAGCVGYLYAGLRGRSDRACQAARALYHVCLGSTVYLTLYLLQSLVSAHRYDIAYVFNNSAPTDEIIYRVSALWAGQQGSLLFWTLACAVAGAALVRRLDREAPLLAAFWLSVMSFFFLLLAADDPFAKLEGFQRGMTGAGMNPLLKNPWMAIHPPVVFLGYALLIVPAAFAVQALAKGDAARWASRSLPWAAAGWASLTAGLALGMVWSYEVLGWGGYWGWDPVENASLVPWLTGGALLHGLVLQRNRGRLALANVVLALGTFLLVLYATFLTRSGVLAEVSVHSFAKTPAHRFLLGMLVFYGVLSAGLTAVRWRVVSPGAGRTGRAKRGSNAAASRDFVLAAGVVVLVLFALVVLVGTSYPIFAKGAIQPQFYNRMSVPLAVAICALVALAPWMRWGGRDVGRASASPALGRVWWALIAAVAVGLVGGVYALAAPGASPGVFGWLTGSDGPPRPLAVQALLILICAALVALASTAIAAARTRPVRAGAFVAHAGVALLAIGTIVSSAGQSGTLALRRDGEAGRALGWSFVYKGIERAGPNKEAILVDARKGTARFTAKLAVEFGERTVVRRPYIRSSLLSDLYIAPTQIDTVTITPTASVTDDGLVALPASIPSPRKGTVTLLGLSVESAAAKLQYLAPGGEPQEITVSAGRPEKIDGYTFTFREFVTDDRGDMQHFTVGVTLGVTGNGLTETAIVEVSRKPMIWLVWLGCSLVFLGGLMSVARRIKENKRVGDGLLPSDD